MIKKVEMKDDEKCFTCRKAGQMAKDGWMKNYGDRNEGKVQTHMLHVWEQGVQRNVLQEQEKLRRYKERCRVGYGFCSKGAGIEDQRYRRY